MENVQCESFLHVHRGRRPEWKVGAKLTFGGFTNKFFKDFDSIAYTVNSPNSQNRWFVNQVAEHLLKVLDGTEDKDQELSKFYHYDPARTLRETYDALRGSLLLIRELIFEEVRIKAFPQHPSRQRCIWLLPENCDALAYWWPALKAEDAKRTGTTDGLC